MPNTNRQSLDQPNSNPSGYNQGYEDDRTFEVHQSGMMYNSDNDQNESDEEFKRHDYWISYGHLNIDVTIYQTCCVQNYVPFEFYENFLTKLKKMFQIDFAVYVCQ